MYLMQPQQFSNAECDELEDKLKADNIALQKSGYRRHVAKSPCVQLVGPIRPLIVANESNHHPLGRGHNYF